MVISAFEYLGTRLKKLNMNWMDSQYKEPKHLDGIDIDEIDIEEVERQHNALIEQIMKNPNLLTELTEFLEKKSCGSAI